MRARVVADFKTICGLHTDSTVSVENGSSTATGLSGQLLGTASLTDEGEAGTASGTVYCVASEIGNVAEGQTITVGGVAAWVMGTSKDSAGALVKIDWQRVEE